MALLRAALSLAATGGFASLGLREVSRAAGIAPTSFYRHFAGMEELGLALVRVCAAPLLERVARSLHEAAQQRADVSRVLLTALQAELDAEPALFRFMIAERVGAVSSLRAALRTHFGTLAESLRAAAMSDKPAWAADAAVVLALDGLDRTIELAGEARAAELEQTLPALHTLLAERTSESPR
jgi:AcrR family transcriptional regulator